jgi:TRAP-type C4-dicarboxylate transport system permease small subunit
MRPVSSDDPLAELDPPLTYPDDGPVARRLRSIDDALGKAEQVVLFGLLVLVIAAATIQAVAHKAFGVSFVWSFEIVRAGVFAIALIGAAFATHQQRNLSMDLVSRRLPPRGRLILRIFLALFTAFIGALFLYAGEHLRQQVTLETHAQIIPMWLVAAMIPVGSVLIMIHSFLHIALDVDYLSRGKLPPERERSAH